MCSSKQKWNLSQCKTAFPPSDVFSAPSVITGSGILPPKLLNNTSNWRSQLSWNKSMSTGGTIARLYKDIIALTSLLTRNKCSGLIQLFCPNRRELLRFWLAASQKSVVDQPHSQELIMNQMNRPWVYSLRSDSLQELKELSPHSNSAHGEVVGGTGGAQRESNFHRHHQSMRQVKRLRSAHMSGNFK